MEIDYFISKRPFLYHLTNKNNVDNIIDGRILLSANTLIDSAKLKDKESLKITKRNDHLKVTINSVEYSIRDQKPITKALDKCLINCTRTQFIKYLNNHVFFWPTLNRLKRHFQTYRNEEVKVLKVVTSELFELNKHILVSRINSGSTRCIASYGGIPVPRGLDTFVNLSDFNKPITKIAEVTIKNKCNLPKSIIILEKGDCEKL